MAEGQSEAEDDEACKGGEELAAAEALIAEVEPMFKWEWFLVLFYKVPVFNDHEQAPCDIHWV